jgi:hypothetical protein
MSQNDSETTVVQTEAEEAEVTTKSVSPLWRFVPVLAFLFLFLAMNASGVSAAGFQEDPGTTVGGFEDLDFTGIMNAFWGSANIVFGMTGLVALIALPYGINFAFQFLTSIFNRFTSAMRF